MTDNIPPEIAENGCFSAPSMAKEILAFRSAPAPVRISPEVRETIMRVLRAHCDSECRWASAVSPHSDGYKAAWARVDEMEDAIAFVEALP